MERDLCLELKYANSRVKKSIKQVKNLINLFSEAHQKMQYSIRETEILTEKNRKEINYLTAQINYNIKR